MKHKRIALNRSKALYQGLVGSVLAWTIISASGQGFINLDFEAGPVYNDSFQPTTQYPDVMPGWTVNAASVGQTNAYCNNFILDYPAVALMSLDGALGSDYVISGQRSVFLQSAASLGNPSSAVNVSISQVGMVPAGTQSLLFEARNQWYGSYPVPPGPFNVTMGDVTVPLIQLFSNGADVTYAANISAWSGQTTELAIGVLASPAWGGANWEGWAVVDSIQFSPQSVPEPGVLSLFAMLGATIFSFRRRKTRALP